MKSKWPRIGIIGLAVVGLLLFPFICGFGHNLIGVQQVVKIELTACDEVETATVELKKGDVRKFITCYNLSRYVGEVEAERCDRTFAVCIYLKDGRQIGIVDHDNERMKVTGMEDQSFWIDNTLLLGIIKKMVNECGLLWESWGGC